MENNSSYKANSAALSVLVIRAGSADWSRCWYVRWSVT